MKTDYEEHAAKEHPEDLPEDLTPEPVAKTGADLNSMQVFIRILVKWLVSPFIPFMA